MLSVSVQSVDPSSVASGFDHDVFVIHADADKPFVQGYLLPELGLAAERVLVLRGLPPGGRIIDEFERGVRASRVTIVVLSPAYMTDGWAVFGEQLAAYAQLAEHDGRRLLPLLRADCDLPDHIRMLVALDFRESARETWQFDAARLRALFDQPATTEPDLPCPYPGMRPFTERDASRFFGRDAELDDLAGRLRHGEREIYIIGASGSGKSSLVAAGLVPMLSEPGASLGAVLVRSFRPGERPFTRLGQVLEADLASPVAALGELLDRHAPSASLLLVIDQLEELFAVSGTDERDAFLGALRALRTEPRCVLVFTLRADFFAAFMESALWTDLDGRISRVELGALRGDSLRAVIERPAGDLGVYLERDLVERLLSDTAREPGALPLLQEALVRLWDRRQHRLLTLADYQALGDGARSGLGRAISDRADSTLRTLTGRQEIIALRILLRLVSFGEGRADTRRQQARAALRSADESAANFDAVLQRLVDDRLVTVAGSSDDGEEVRIDLAHEALILAWPTFAGWIKTWRSHENRRRELEAAAATWRARGSGDGGLLDVAEHAEAVAWRTRAAHQLGESRDLAAFIAASEAVQARSIHRHRWRVHIAFVALAVFLGVTSTLAIVARYQANEAKLLRGNAEIEEDKNRRLLAESAQLYQEIGRQLLFEAERPLQAILYLVKAREANGGDAGSSLRMLFGQASRNLPLVTLAHQGEVVRAAFSPDSTRVVTASWDKTARVWNATIGTPITLPLVHQGRVVSAAFSPDGARIVTASWDKTARVWDATTGTPITQPLAHEGRVVSAAFSPDGRRVVTASWDRTARVWDATTGTPITQPLVHQGRVGSAVFSPDGARIVTASWDKTVRVWDAVTGAQLTPPLAHQGTLESSAISRDGTRIVIAGLDNTARVWDAATGRPITPPLVHHDIVVSAVFSPDGARVVTASLNKAARVWDAVTGMPLEPSLLHQGAAVSAVVSPDGASVVTDSWDQTTGVWDATADTSLKHQGSVTSAAFSPDGTRLVTISGDNTTRVWDAATGEPLTLPLEHQGVVTSAAFSPDGTRVVTTSSDGARVWDVATGEPFKLPLARDGLVESAAFCRGGTRVVITSSGNTARVWDVATGKPLTPLLEHQGVVTSAAFSRDGTRVVTTSLDNTARVWDAATGKPLTPPLSHQGGVTSAVFSRDGTRVVTTSMDNTARVWDAATGKPLTSPLRHQGGVTSAGFSRDDAHLVTMSADNMTRVWDATTGDPVTLSLKHQGSVMNVAFSREGARVVTASPDNTARVWDAATGKPLTPPLAQEAMVSSAAFSPDGARVVIASGNTVRVWDAATGRPLTPPLTHQGNVKRVAFSLQGDHVVMTSVDHPARMWDLPLGPGTAVEWAAVAERASPYVLVNGVLSTRPAANGSSTSHVPTAVTPRGAARRRGHEVGDSHRDRPGRSP